MKKILLTIICSLITIPVFAGPHHYHNRPYYRPYTVVPSYNWVAPAIIGGVIGYGLSRPYVVEQPVIVQQQPTIVATPIQPTQTTVQCSEWRETLLPDGRIVQERTCRQ